MDFAGRKHPVRYKLNLGYLGLWNGSGFKLQVVPFVGFNLLIPPEPTSLNTYLPMLLMVG